MRTKKQGPTAQQVATLVELYRQGAAEHAVSLSTSALGELLDLSQQAVSKQLLQLEEEGMVERKRAGRGTLVSVTPKGGRQVLSLYTNLKETVEGRQGAIVIHGRVFTGLGEGAYYTSLAGYARQFRKLLGFSPYPGTLNLAVDSSDSLLRRRLDHMPSLEVKAFKDGRRTFGPVKCLKAKVEGKYEAAALVIERTHHGDAVLEVISPVNLRKALALAEGDRVSVSIAQDV